MEERLGVPPSARFPLYRHLMWHAAAFYLGRLQSDASGTLHLLNVLHGQGMVYIRILWSLIWRRYALDLRDGLGFIPSAPLLGCIFQGQAASMMQMASPTHFFCSCCLQSLGDPARGGYFCECSLPSCIVQKLGQEVLFTGWQAQLQARLRGMPLAIPCSSQAGASAQLLVAVQAAEALAKTRACACRPRSFFGGGAEGFAGPCGCAFAVDCAC